MTLLITVFAAIISTVIWYVKENDLKIEILCFMYWGASLMWFVDAVVEYFELGAEYFTPLAADMLNDSFLGISVVAFGLIIWLVCLFVNDPKGRIRSVLLKSKK